MRMRLTTKNIERQQADAPAGTLVHWYGSDTCQRKLNDTDVKVEGSLTYTAKAIHYGNITCLRCRKEAWAAGLR